MRILFLLLLASAFIIGLIFELDHGLTRGKVTVPEALQFKENSTATSAQHPR